MGIEWDLLQQGTPLSGEDFGGLERGKNGTFPPKNSPEREKIGGRRGGKMGTKKGPQRFATSPSQGVIIREILCAS